MLVFLHAVALDGESYVMPERLHFASIQSVSFITWRWLWFGAHFDFTWSRLGLLSPGPTVSDRQRSMCNPPLFCLNMTYSNIIIIKYKPSKPQGYPCHRIREHGSRDEERQAVA